MTREDIIRLMREAGVLSGRVPKRSPYVDDFSRFAALVAAAEREACAKVCEEQITGSDYYHLANHGHWDHMVQSAVNCAAAIRKRGEVKP